MARYCLFIVLSLCFISCGKRGREATPVADTTGTLINNRTYPLTVDIYATTADRLNHLNIVHSCMVPAMDSYKVPYSKVNASALYYYDIYSSDYMYSNWPWVSSGIALYSYGYANKVDLGSHAFSQARYYFMRGNNEKTIWKAVNRMVDTTSEWAGMDDSSKHMLLEIYRDGFATLNYYELHAIPTFYMHDTASFMEGNKSDYYTTLVLTGLQTVSYSYIYNTPTKPIYGVSGHCSVDTLILEYASRNWVMVRQ